MTFRIEVPTDYFARAATREYTDGAGMALIREFAQNACDAGARSVSFTFSAQAPRTLMVEDDGSGLTLEQLKRRILTPLASVKEGDAIGGFGKAKELLYFANPEWRIETQNVYCVGSFLDVKTLELTACSEVKGFRAVIQPAASLFEKAQMQAKYFMACSERKTADGAAVQWLLNGSIVPSAVRRPARALKDFGFAKVYVDKTITSDSHLYLRTGGLLTSTRWCPAAKYGRVIIEVTGRSSELLTPARDWFAKEEHRREIENFIHRLSTDANALEQEALGDEVHFFSFAEALEGAAVIAGRPESMRDAIPRMGSTEAKVAFGQEALEPAAVEQPAVSDQPAIEIEIDPTSAVGTLLTALAEQRKAQRKPPERLTARSLPRIEGLGRVVVHTGGKAQAKIALRWLKKNAALAQRLLAAWAMACRVVTRQNGLPMDAVGFTFMPKAEAEFVASNGRFGFLLNPLMLDPKDYYTIDELIDRALHEVAHLTVSSHDEAFVIRESQLRRSVRSALCRSAVARAFKSGEVETYEPEQA